MLPQFLRPSDDDFETDDVVKTPKAEVFIKYDAINDSYKTQDASIYKLEEIASNYLNQ